MTSKLVKISKDDNRLLDLISDYPVIQEAVNEARRMNYTPRAGKAFNLETFRFGQIINLIYRGQEVRPYSLRIISFFGKKDEQRYGIEKFTESH